MKTRNKLAIVLLIFFICISPISLSALFDFDYSRAADFEEITSDQEWSIDRVIDKNIIINAGVTLIVASGVTLTFKRTEIFIDGNMLINGTRNRPVVLKKDLTRDDFALTVGETGNLTMRNVDISGSGYGLTYVKNDSIINSALASMAPYYAGINVKGGTLSAQGCNFHDNNVAIYVDWSSSGKVVVNRSKFINNKDLDVGFFDGYAPRTVDFRYNWWGSADGPPQNGYKITENVDFSNWLTSENFHDPVVIIPGVFGSQKENDVWKIDPIFHVYDNLIDAFKNNGYTIGKDLFIFPYEWRDSNVENAIKLRYKITEIKNITNWPKVDIVAHSMGGLLAREYIESSSYQKDVDQLITLGTPNNGSPEIYPLWEAGKSIGAVQAGMKKFLEQEMEEAGHANMFEYVRSRPISSAQELLPNYEYLFDLDENQPLLYPSAHPVNDFLDKLNNSVNVKKLINVEYIKIVGKVSSDKSTIAGFNVIKVDLGEIWKHGYPLSFEIPILGDRGTSNGFGDGTVPFASAKSAEIFSDTYLELNSFHAALPTDAQKDVLETLTGIRPSTEVTDGLIKNMLQIFVHSPIDIQIVSPSGLRVGKDFENSGKVFNEIEGAFYSGSETENEFVTIPNPEDGEYRILTEGTGNGEFRIEAVKISEDLIDSENVIESAMVISGKAEINKKEELNVEVVGNVVTDKNAEIVIFDPVIKPTPVSPPATPPVTNVPSASMVLGSATINPVVQSTQQTSVKKSSKKKSKSKKKKSHKKSKKAKVSKLSVQVKKVLGISRNKSIKQKNIITKPWSYAAKKGNILWKNTIKTASNLKDFIFKPFTYFKK